MSYELLLDGDQQHCSDSCRKQVVAQVRGFFRKQVVAAAGSIPDTCNQHRSPCPSTFWHLTMAFKNLNNCDQHCRTSQEAGLRQLSDITARPEVKPCYTQSACVLRSMLSILAHDHGCHSIQPTSAHRASWVRLMTFPAHAVHATACLHGKNTISRQLSRQITQSLSMSSSVSMGPDRPDGQEAPAWKPAPAGRCPCSELSAPTLSGLSLGAC